MVEKNKKGRKSGSMETGKIIRKASQWAAFLVLSGCMAAIPGIHYLCLKNDLHTGYIAQTIYGFALAGAAVLAATLFFRRKEIRFTRYEILFGLLLVFAALSVTFSGNPYQSVHGSSARCEGLFMLHSYYLFFYLARLVEDPRLRRGVVYVFLGVQTVHCLYGLNQQYHFIQGGFDYYFYAISGLAGNPNFMGTLTVMASALALGLLIYSGKVRDKAICLVLLGVFLATLLLTKTLSAVVGFWGMVLVGLGYLNRKRWKWFLAILAGGAVLFGGLLLLTNGTGNNFLSSDLAELAGQLPTLAAEGLTDPAIGSGRLYLWNNCFQLFLRHPLTGVGIDNLQVPYYENFGLLLGQYADKCHNELLQVLVTMGIGAFGCYLAFYGFLFRDLGKRLGEEKSVPPLEAALLLCLTGYLIQGCFNISVIDVAPYFWMLCGLMAEPLFGEGPGILEAQEKEKPA